MTLSISAVLPTLPDRVTMPSSVWMLMPRAIVGRFARNVVSAWFVMAASVFLMPSVSPGGVSGLPPESIGRGDTAELSG